jgi:hypothetical protein
MPNLTEQGISRGFTGQAKSSLVDEQIFSSGGQWQKPQNNGLLTYMYCLGGGGGGASGSAYQFRTAGGGGSAGGADLQMFLTASLPDVLDVTVGAGGTGGIKPAADNTQGVSGNQGGISKISSGTLAGGDLIVYAQGDAGRGAAQGTSYSFGGQTHNRGMFQSQVVYQGSNNYYTSFGAGGHAFYGMQGIAGSIGQAGGGGAASAYYNGTLTQSGAGGRGSVFFHGIKIPDSPTANNRPNVPISWAGGFRPNYQAWNSLGGYSHPAYPSNRSYFAPESGARGANVSSNGYVYFTYGGGGGALGYAASQDGGNGTNRDFGGDGGGGGVGIQFGDTSNPTRAGHGGNGGYPAGGGGGGGSYVTQYGNNASSPRTYPAGNGGNGSAGKVWIWTVGVTL